ncbi:MAG: DUF3575 domain-containing protein [Alistipes sp.]|nr:DUF3575 domain-containing protein [Candidatus Alistipes equi]
MKRIVLSCIILFCVFSTHAEIYGKLNLMYAAIGIIHPQFEFQISPNATVSADFVYSPWKSIVGKYHMNFGILQAEARYYFKSANKGWYASGNVGMQIFDMNKPIYFKDGLLSFNRTYSKGGGFMAGIGIGWERPFRERWVVDIFFAFDFMLSWYNGYTMDGIINMNPQGHEHYRYADPFNASSEFLPSKIGVSIGYRIFSRKNHPKNSSQK